MHSHFLLGNVLEQKELVPLVHLHQISTIPSSGAKAGRSVEEGFAGAQRGENEVGHRLPQPEKGVPLLDGKCKV